MVVGSFVEWRGLCCRVLPVSGRREFCRMEGVVL